MHRAFGLMAVMSACAALAACGSEQSLLDTESSTALQAPDLAAASSSQPVREYRISPQDKLNVSVYPDKTMSLTDVRVDANGSILVPPLGAIRVDGRTTSEVGQMITDGLSKCCLRAPQVAVQVTEGVNQQFTVAGAVKAPNTYVMRGHINLLQAVSMAGGPDVTVADLKRVGVIRVIDGRRTGKVFNLQQIMSGRDVNPEVYAGDEIIVDSDRAKGAWKNVLQAIPLAPLFAFF